jgi:hypothetical protein
MITPEPRLRCVKLRGISGEKCRKNWKNGSCGSRGPCGPNLGTPRELIVWLVETLTTAGFTVRTMPAKEDGGDVAVPNRSSLGAVGGGWPLLPPRKPKGFGNAAATLTPITSVRIKSDEVRALLGFMLSTMH